MREHSRALACGALAAVLWLSSAAAAEPHEAWRSLRAGGHVAMLRHALAPGTGDPAGFDVTDCATQRNLSDEGRDQARAIGDAFRAAGVHEARVLSSEWCRCLETARLLGLGPVEPLPALNSFYQRAHERDARLAALRVHLGALNTRMPVVLVTHQVTISAMTGGYPASGELFVVALDAAALDAGAVLPVAGRVRVDP